jgi:hypothetical protein
LALEFLDFSGRSRRIWQHGQPITDWFDRVSLLAGIRSVTVQSVAVRLAIGRLPGRNVGSTIFAASISCQSNQAAMLLLVGIRSGPDYA